MPIRSGVEDCGIEADAPHLRGIADYRFASGHASAHAEPGLRFEAVDGFHRDPLHTRAGDDRAGERMLGAALHRRRASEQLGEAERSRAPIQGVADRISGCSCR